MDIGDIKGGVWCHGASHGSACQFQQLPSFIILPDMLIHALNEIYI